MKLEHRRHFRDLVDDLSADCRYAIRSLSRQPLLAAAAVLCLAIGLAANATMFNVVDTLLLRPPAGVRDAGSLLWISAARHYSAQDFTEYPGASYPDYVEMASLPEISSAAGYFEAQQSFGQGREVQQISTLTVTHTFMSVLGVKPALGRFFDADEDSMGGPDVIVLGYAFWQREFGGSSLILGKTVRIETTPYVVVGVAPRDFNGLERTHVDAYLPVGAGLPGFHGNPSAPFTNRQFSWLSVVARVRPGIARAGLEAKLATLYDRIDRREPVTGTTLELVVASPMAIVAMQNPQQAQDATVSIWLDAVAVIVLLIACANVASLLLTRAFRRRREIAVRLALGISKARLIRLLMLEGILLVAAGGVLAVILGWVGTRTLRSTLLSGADLGQSYFNARVLAVSLAAMAFTGLATGLVPALDAADVDLAGSMRGASRESAGHRGPMHTALLVAQIALALVLSVGAALFTQSFRNLAALDLGFDVEHVLRVRGVDPTSIGYTDAQATQVSQQLVERIRALPGVARVAVATGGPFAGESGRPLWISGRAVPNMFGGGPVLAMVSPEFFETLGMALRRGRLFTSSDRAKAPLVTVIDEDMARRYWPGEDALGKCILIGSGSAPCTTVIGIVATARQGNAVDQPIQYEKPASRYYLPIETSGVAPVLYVRSTSDATKIAPMVRQTISELEPELPYPDVTAFSTALDPQFRPWRLGASMFSLFGAIALLLAVIGLYGVLAFRVSQRTHEIGIRMSLGAQEADVRNLVIGQGLRLAAFGSIIGVLLSVAVGRTANSLLYGVSATSPFILAAVCVSILVIAVVASYVPARRATRIDPLEALREL
ncbi:MAG TPA: ABC transporter permease [Gemmatimonadaceae bacterium]|jgi:predicted permease